jgi:hypothetical protein
MFTEKDYIEYFEALQNAERKMISNMDKILSGISDESTREVVLRIKKDEAGHLKMEDKLLEILQLDIEA